MDFVKSNYYEPRGHGSNFTVHINPLPTTFQNYYKESLLAAEEINSLKVGKLHLLYSGGLDSENTLSVFLSAGIPIVPVIINMIQGYNTYDTKYAFDFCRSKNLTPLVINIDFDHFVSSGKMLEVAQICKSEIYHRALTAFVAEKLDGTVICGDGEMYIKPDQQSLSWVIHLDEHEFAVYRYFEKKGIDGTTHFNTYRPEMMSAMLTDPVMFELASNRRPHKQGSNSSKVEIYNRHSGFNLIARPKYHGYEQIEQSPIFKHPYFQELHKQGKRWNGSYDIDFFAFMKKYNLCKQ
jgi:hypothetical protein